MCNLEVGQRVLVETWSDDVWGIVISFDASGFYFQGENWSMPLFFTYKALVKCHVCRSQSAMTQLTGRNGFVFYACADCAAKCKRLIAKGYL